MCDIGYYDTGSCQPCEINTYKDTTGPGPCTTCANNTITSSAGNTSPTDCRKLHYSSKKNNNRLLLYCLNSRLTLKWTGKGTRKRDIWSGARGIK